MTTPREVPKNYHGFLLLGAFFFSFVAMLAAIAGMLNAHAVRVGLEQQGIIAPVEEGTFP